MGFCDIVGITSDYMQHSFNWSSTLTGFVPSMVFIWFLFLGIPIGNQMNRWGRKNTVLVSMGITVVGMLLPFFHYSSATCVVAYMLLGIGITMLQISLNPLLSNVITDGKLMASSLTAGQVIKAVSSLVGPEIVLFSTTRFGGDHWYYCFPILGVVTLFFAFWLMLTPIEREKAPAEVVSIGSSISVLRNKRVLVLFFGIFFIVGVDVATNYISSKVMAVRYGWLPEQVKYAPQVYFLCRTVGALLGTILLTKVFCSTYFRVNIVACAMSLLGLMLTCDPVISMIGIGAVGFFGASVFSIVFSMAFQECPDKMNQVSGLMITAVAGGGIISPILGLAIDMAGINAGLLVILVCVMYLVYCAFGVTPNGGRDCQ